MSPAFDSPPQSSTDFDVQRPRPHRTASQLAHVIIQNRRRVYLTRHPSYFTSPDHELADPLLYDSLIRRYQSVDERTEEGRAKGYGRVLESSLIRGETRLERMAVASLAGEDRSSERQPHGPGVDAGSSSSGTLSKEDALEQWHTFIREQFVKGHDDDFDYSKVDGDEALDGQQRRDEEEEWFDDEKPTWADAESGDSDCLSRPRFEGETGIQDY